MERGKEKIEKLQNIYTERTGCVEERRSCISERTEYSADRILSSRRFERKDIRAPTRTQNLSAHSGTFVRIPVAPRESVHRIRDANPTIYFSRLSRHREIACARDKAGIPEPSNKDVSPEEQRLLTGNSEIKLGRARAVREQRAGSVN